MIHHIQHMPFHIINYYCKKLVAMFDSKSTEISRFLAIRGPVVLPHFVLPHYRTLCGHKFGNA